MKLGIIGDTHFTSSKPSKRMDDYCSVQLDKMEQSFKIFEKAKCNYIVQTGDLIDTPTINNKMKAAIISLFRKYFHVTCNFSCIWGQHDISGHSKSTLVNSPLAVFKAAGIIKILDEKPRIETEKIENVGLKDYCFYGASFSEPIPEVEDKNAYNILVIHAMIGDRQLYPNQELTGPRQFLRKNPDYNLVIAGDYHYRFIDSYMGRTIINPGALMRKTVSKFDLEHKPAVVIFDTETNNYEVVELNVRPVEEVFDFSEETKRKDNIRLDSFIQQLKNSRIKTEDSWKEILSKVLVEKNSSEDVKKLLDSCLQEIQK